MAKKSTQKQALLSVQIVSEELHPTQKEFNRLVSLLDKQRVKYEKSIKQMDSLLEEYKIKIFPLRDKLQRTEFDLIISAVAAYHQLKLSKVTKQNFGIMIYNRANDLLKDTFSLSAEELSKIEEIDKEFEPEMDDFDDDDDDLMAEFMEIRDAVFAATGVKIDMDDLDINADPVEIERELHMRYERALEQKSQNQKPRKLTKAQIAKQQRELEAEEAKKLSFKSLFKQLAKLLHPDLETETAEKVRKEHWMKRLTTAYEKGDLREMIQIEIEWIGHEQSDLHQASIEKLQIYNTVLKEQIEEWKRKIYQVPFEAQFQTLRRFIHPMSVMPTPIKPLSGALKAAIAENASITATLQQLDQGTRVAIQAWAKNY